MSDFFSAVELGAATVYHRALQAVPAVLEWTETHPEITPLLKEAAAFATPLIGNTAVAGLPVGPAVLAALKLLAAKDPTVPST